MYLDFYAYCDGCGCDLPHKRKYPEDSTVDFDIVRNMYSEEVLFCEKCAANPDPKLRERENIVAFRDKLICDKLPDFFG